MKKTKYFTRKVYLYILFYTSIIAFFIPKVNIFLTFYSQNITFLYATQIHNKYTHRNEFKHYILWFSCFLISHTNHQKHTLIGYKIWYKSDFDTHLTPIRIFLGVDVKPASNLGKPDFMKNAKNRPIWNPLLVRATAWHPWHPFSLH